MTTEEKVLLSAVCEAVLVAVGALPVESYAQWEELIDAVCDLHEQLNDRKPSTVTTRDE